MRPLKALRPSRVHGAGALALLGTLCAQGLAATLLAQAPDPHLSETRRRLAASVVVEPPLGGTPIAASGDTTAEAGSRLQLTFAPSQESWTAVLWFEGDRVVPLYPDPARGLLGWTDASTYAVPGPGAWLRLTPTGDAADFVAVVNGLRPDAQIVATLDHPTPTAVRALRRRLETEARARTPVRDGVERYLPTADGRSIPAPWHQISGTGPLVLGWRITVHSGVWHHRTTSSSSAPASPERSSPNAS